MTTKNKKSEWNSSKINEISSPITNEGNIKAETVPIKLFGKKDFSDEKRASISSDTSTSSSFTFRPGDDTTSIKSRRSSDSDIDSLSEASNLYSSNESLYSVEDLDLNEDKEPHNFVFEDDIDDTLSSHSSNNTNHNPHSLFSFSTFSDSKLNDPESSKSKRRVSVDSGISSPSEASSISSSQDSVFMDETKPPLEDEKAKIVKFATVKKPGAPGKLVKVIPSTVPTFKSQSSDISDSNLTSIVVESLDNTLSSEKPMGKGVKEINRKDQLPSKIDEFIPQEAKNTQAREQQEQKKLQDEILKNNIKKIEGAISTAKSKVDLKERYDFLLHQLGKVQTRFNQDKKLHPDLKEVITKLRRERWASQTNMWAIKPDDVTKNYLPESKVELTFAEKREIFTHKRNVAKNLLDSKQARGEDKKILKELYKRYSNLAKSSEKKPEKKSNLEYAFKKEFGDTYKKGYEMRLKEFENPHQKSCSTKLSEPSVSQVTSALSK